VKLRILLAAALLAAVGLGVWALGARSGGSAELQVAWRAPAALPPGVSVREGFTELPRRWRVVDLAIDLGKAELRVARAPGAGGAGGRLADMVPPGALAAVNGGYFDEKYRPVGWLVDRGTELAPRVSRTSGGVVAVRAGGLYIGPLKEVPWKPEFALQNGPRLVEAAGQIGIRTDDGKRAARTVACDAAGRLHLILLLAPPHEGPTLHETARLLVAMGCRAALNLDGGPSSGLWLPEAAGLAASAPAAPIAYGLAVMPR